LKGRRQDLEYEESQQEIDSFCTTVNRPCKATCLTIEVKAQGKGVQVAECLYCGTTNGPLRNADKQKFFELGEKLLT
jgi:hypothetical protein